MNYVAPAIYLTSFHCPFCGAFAHMVRTRVFSGHDPIPYIHISCSHCEKSSMWKVTKYKGVEPTQGVMLYPNSNTAPPAERDMPEDVKADYEEAASIFSKSPRGAAALLRLGLQKLCKHLGKDGKNINSDIRALAAENVLPPMVVKVADTVRITGNNAVHPGEMSEEDFDHVASKMFDLLNFIVKKAITEPMELQSLYEMTPEKPRLAAENTDEKNRTTEES